MNDQNIKLINSEEFCSENEKKLFLIQLPKELVGIKNLKLNFNDLKHGSIIEIVSIEYV